MNYINQMNSATSVRPNMKIDYLLNYQLLIPPIEKQIQFVKAVEVLMNAISLNNNERLKLCDFQSTLLKAYKAITDRIALKKQINDNLAA